MNKMYLPALASLALAAASPLLLAGEEAGSIETQKIVVAISADEFELAETDVSHLAVGDAETIMTESGRTIDILRTAQGVEIYLDGELLDTGFDGDIEAFHELEFHADGVHEREYHDEEHGSKVIIIERRIEDEI